jgi:diketogulonate reductase-like aldo/keto reductase
VCTIFGAVKTMKTVALPSGETVPALGQGTWMMAEKRGRRAAEIAALRLGVELGMTLIDTAEMYADGGAEELVAEAVGDRRGDLFLVSKVLPQNASRTGTVAACERSLKRLNTDRIDLYLLHWTGSHPLAETVAGFEALMKAGKIRHWGVSNFDTEDMQELFAISGGRACATNQILYNVKRRTPEYDLIPLLAQHDIPVMAYSPLEQTRLPVKNALAKVGAKHNATSFQIALAWLLRQDGMIVIPKASSDAHVRDNFAALKIELDADDLAAIDAEFAPPSKKRPLESL